MGIRIYIYIYVSIQSPMSRLRRPCVHVKDSRYLLLFDSMGTGKPRNAQSYIGSLSIVHAPFDQVLDLLLFLSFRRIAVNQCKVTVVHHPWLEKDREMTVALARTNLSKPV